MYRQLHKVLNLVKKNLKKNNTKCVLYYIMVVSFFECVLNFYFYFSGVMIGEAQIFFLF